MKRIKKHVFIQAVVVTALLPSLLFAKLRVVATTQDLASIAHEIGGDAINLDFISKGYQDPHFVESKPSYVLKLNNADLLIVVGLELEVGWLPPLLTTARNSKILPGNPGFLDASEGCEILEKPGGTVDRSMGDVHPFGNPHYWTDPENGRVIARHIAEKLAELDRSNATLYQGRLKEFEGQLSSKEKEWRVIADSFKGLRVVTYHNSWPNFTKAFGIQVVGFIEPKPGISPTPRHTEAIVNQIREQKVPLIFVEPFFDSRLPKQIANLAGAKMMILLPSVGGVPNIKSYFELFDHDLRLIQESFKGPVRTNGISKGGE